MWLERHLFEGFSHPKLFKWTQVCVCNSVWVALQGASKAARWGSIPRCGAPCSSSLHLTAPKRVCAHQLRAPPVMGLCVSASLFGTNNSRRPLSSREHYSSWRGMQEAAVQSGFGAIYVTFPGLCRYWEALQDL